MHQVTQNLQLNNRHSVAVPPKGFSKRVVYLIWTFICILKPVEPTKNPLQPLLQVTHEAQQ